jgi:hypothetical protein
LSWLTDLQPGVGLTLADEDWSIALDAALMMTHRDDLKHGTNAAYGHGCVNGSGSGEEISGAPNAPGPVLGTGIICCVMIIGTALVAVLTVLGGLAVGHCWRLPASRSVIPGGGVGVAIAAMPEIAHRGIGLPLTTGNALAGWSPSVVEGL